MARVSLQMTAEMGTCQGEDATGCLLLPVEAASARTLSSFVESCELGLTY
jgi:hypothetical protein